MSSKYFKAPPRVKLNTEAIAANNAREKVLSNDLQIIYSSVCIVLHNQYGWDTDQLAEFLNQVQTQCVENLQTATTSQSWIDKCEEITGIQLILR